MRYLSLIALAAFAPALAFAQGDEHHNPQPFGLWLADFQKDAASQGISKPTLANAFKETQLLDNVIKLDRKQPEGSKTLQEYVQSAVNTQRVVDGKVKLETYKVLLSDIENRYGVDRQAIVALWGIETNYGENTGNFSVIDALATLAYDGRRSDFFRAELINALKIVDADHIQPEVMDGSWAGAMGQCQFMPTSFLKFAVDYDGDGRRDIWTTEADIFASIANYLKTEGWKKGGEISMPVLLPENFDSGLTDITLVKSVSEWKKLGVTYNDGSPLPDSDESTSVIMVGNDKEAVPYIIYNNYKVILKWNRSRYFATAVDMLIEEFK